MRPRGEVRAALAAAVARLAAEQGPVSAREVACAVQANHEVVRLTLKDMARSARPEVVRVGSSNDGNNKTWNALYEPAQQVAPSVGGDTAALTSACRSWVEAAAS